MHNAPSSPPTTAPATAQSADALFAAVYDRLKAMASRRLAADASKRNYHLLAYIQNGQVTASPGIDFAEAGSGDAIDLDGNPYDQDVPLVPNFAGPRDLGAYEAQPIADRIFGDAFGDRLSLVVVIK